MTQSSMVQVNLVDPRERYFLNLIFNAHLLYCICYTHGDRKLITALHVLNVLGYTFSVTYVTTVTAHCDGCSKLGHKR